MNWLEGSIGTKRGLALILMASVLFLTLSGLAQAWTPAIDKAESQAEALQRLIDQLDEELSAADEEYVYAAQQLEDTQAAIKKTQKLLTKSEADLTTIQDRLNRRVVEIYKSGDLTMLSVLMDANSFTDLIDRYDQLQRLSKQDADLLAQVQDDKTPGGRPQSPARRPAEAGEDRRPDDRVGEGQGHRAAREANEGAQGQRSPDHQAQEGGGGASGGARGGGQEGSSRGSAQSRGREGGERGGGEGRRQKKAAPTTGSSGAGTGGSYDADRSAQVVQIALQYTGVPYVWGGTSPSGFDCSGLVKYAYAKIGISICLTPALCSTATGRTSPRDQLKPGDLVFFYSPIHHVGMYIGNGQMVNATGDHVQIGTVWKTSYYGARRILN